MNQHVDQSGADHPTRTNSTYSETLENRCPQNATDLANEALDAAGGDHGVAVTMLRNAVDHVTAGEL